MGALLPLQLRAQGAAQQQRQPPRVELRVDAIASAEDVPPAVHLGGGVGRAAGLFRMMLIAGIGPSREGMSGRVEGVVRFHVDPYRERRWAPYGVAGGGAYRAKTTEPFVIVALGLEGPPSGGWAPAIEAGFARGVRVALALRRTPANRR